MCPFVSRCSLCVGSRVLLQSNLERDDGKRRAIGSISRIADGLLMAVFCYDSVGKVPRMSQWLTAGTLTSLSIIYGGSH